MIQTALFFILGFLAAGFLAVLVAPAIWRRAVVLTQRRIEAALPLRLNEFRAEKDMLRAEFAVSIRKLEMQIKALKEKAVERMLLLERRDEEIRDLTEKRAEQEISIAGLEARIAELEAELEARGGEIATLTEQGEGQQKLLDERAKELKKLGEMYDEASFSASSRQIELVSRDAKLDKLSQDITAARSERKEADRKAREAAAEAKAQQPILRAAQKKVAALEKQVERLTVSASEAEEKTERRERELQRLKEKIKNDNKSERAIQSELAAEQDKRAMLEERLKALTQENRTMRGELGRLRRTGTRNGGQREAAQLRDQISQLAAEMVNLTATLEGPDSPIESALEAPKAKNGATATSLADRIRKLQKASSVAR